MKPEEGESTRVPFNKRGVLRLATLVGNILRHPGISFSNDWYLWYLFILTLDAIVRLVRFSQRPRQLKWRREKEVTAVLTVWVEGTVLRF